MVSEEIKDRIKKKRRSQDAETGLSSGETKQKSVPKKAAELWMQNTISFCLYFFIKRAIK